MTDDGLEARLRAWYRSEAAAAKAPTALTADVVGIPGSVAVPRWTAPSWLARRPAIALAAVAAAVIVAVLGLRLGGAAAIVGGDPSPSPAATSPSVASSPGPDATPGLPVVGPATYDLPWPGGPAGARVRVAVPAGQAVWASGPTITVTADGLAPSQEDPGSPDLAIHDVVGVVDEVCAHSDPKRHLVAVGPTTDDLVVALEAQQGWTDRSGPVDDTVAGYPARKFTFDLAIPLRFGCLDPAEGVMLWQDRDGSSFVELEGRQGTVSVWVVDVEGHRLILTATDHLQLSTKQQRATREAILDSLQISLQATPAATPRPGALPLSGQLEPGRYHMPWGNLVPYLTVPAGWSSADGGATISKYDPDQYRPRLTLTAHGVAPYVAIDACTDRATLVQVLSRDELIAALTNLAGVELTGPTEVTIGGYPAKKFELTLPSGCPGPEEGQGIVFQEWGPRDFGLVYGGTGTVYVVDVGTADALVVTTSALDATAEDLAELEAIVASITIE